MRRIERLKVWKDMSVREMLDQMKGAGFSAKRLGEAVDVWEAMIGDKDCAKFLCPAGALIAGGMRNVFVEAIENDLVDGIITTGSMLTHDLIESFGIHHQQGTAIVSDIELSKQNIDRIYNVYLPNEGYTVLEEKMQKILPELPQEEMSPNKLIGLLGEKLNDEESFIKAAAKKKIPIFAPSITDSMLGFQIWMYGQDHKLKMNPQLDIKDFFDIIWEGEKKKFGAIILGGGVPKHFVAGMMQASGNSLNYAIQVTMDRPEHGGVSGASLSEAKSWKKVAADALTADIICDSTIAFPLLVAALTKTNKKE